MVANIIDFPERSARIREVLRSIDDDVDHLSTVVVLSMDRAGQVSCSWAEASPEKLALMLFVFESTLRDIVSSDEVAH